MAQRRRGLGDVLHYFIPEAEQREARARAAAGARPAAGARWCLPAAPGRPLLCQLAVDLARALAETGVTLTVAAPFPAAFARGAARGVSWREVSAEHGSLAESLQASGEPMLLLLPPETLSATLGSLPPGFLTGVLLPVNASRFGLAEGLALLRSLPRDAGLRVGVALVAGEREQDGELFAKLEGAARRQLGLELERFGVLQRDRACFRSLLEGGSVLDLAASSASAARLRELARLLAQTAFAAPA